MAAKNNIVFEKRWFWVVLLIIPVSLYGGMQSAGDDPAPLIVEAPTQEQQPKPQKPLVQQYRPQRVQLAPADSAARGGYSAVHKLMESGVIKRVNEAQRRLYVNDPVWKVISHEQKEHTARVVAEYLDWVHKNNNGSVDIRSFRNGKRLGSLGTMQPTQPMIEH